MPPTILHESCADLSTDWDDPQSYWESRVVPEALVRAVQLRDSPNYDRTPFGVVREFGEAALTMGVLRRHLNVRRNETFPSVERIAQLMQCRKRTVQRHLAKLSDPRDGLIRHRRWQGAKVYAFTEKGLNAYAVGPNRRHGQGADGYGVLPHWAYAIRLRPKRRLLYAYLLGRACVLHHVWEAQFANDFGHFDLDETPPAPFLRVKEISSRLGFQKATVTRGLRSLQDRGWIKVLEGRRAYHFVPGDFPELTGLPAGPDPKKRRPRARRSSTLDALVDAAPPFLPNQPR